MVSCLLALHSSITIHYGQSQLHTIGRGKGVVFAIKNINRVVSLTILQIKRDFSDDDEVSMAKKRQEEEDLKLLLGEGE